MLAPGRAALQGRRSALGGAAVLCAALGLAACGGPRTIHVLASLTLDTPSGPRTGASVLFLSVELSSGRFTFPEAGGATITVIGEAPVVTLDDGRMVFVPLRQSLSVYQWLFWANPDAVSEGEPRTVEAVVDAVSDQTGARIVPPGKYPAFATFEDPLDPTSVIVLTQDDIAEVLGTGHAISSFTVEVVDGPVSMGAVEAILPWTKGDRLDRLCAGDGPFDPNDDCSNFVNSDFILRALQ